MNFPDYLLYTKDHEWCLVEDDFATVGITDFAQEQLGDVVYVELPVEGDEIFREDAFGLIESPKAVSDLFSPISGKVAEVNDPVIETPALINDDPYEEGWLIKVELTNLDELKELMSAEQYSDFVSGDE